MEGLDDKHEIYRPYKAPCANCRNGFDVTTFTCKAFPKGIPNVILVGNDKHLQPTKGQEGSLVFAHR